MRLSTHAFATMLTCASLVALSNMTGCDRTKAEHETTVTHPDGSQTVEKSKTVESSDGSTKTTSETEHKN